MGVRRMADSVGCDLAICAVNHWDAVRVTDLFSWVSRHVATMRSGNHRRRPSGP